MSTTDRSSFTLSLCLIWKTERPYANKSLRSPCFTYMNCEWYLELQFAKDQYNNYYFSLFITATKEQKNFPTFSVQTYYKNGRFCLFRKDSLIAEASGDISLVPLFNIEKDIPNFKGHGILTIVCVFDDAVESTQLSGVEGQESIHFPLKADSQSSSKISSECSSSATSDTSFSLENLSKDLEALLDDNILPDVQLMVEGTSIPCHKPILVARSKVFAAMFQHDMTESASGVLNIEDIDLSTTEVFLKYLYSGKFPDDLTDDMLLKLFETGDKYDVKALKAVSSRRIIKNINDKNCLSYLSLADTHSDQEFKDAVVRYIIKDDRLIKSEDWKKFAAENSMLAVEVYSKYIEK